LREFDELHGDKLRYRVADIVCASTVAYTTYIRRTAPTEEEDEQNAKFFGGPALKILKNEENLSWSTYIGAAGMPGKTAYMAWKEYSPIQGHIGQAKVAYISAGSGPVGSLAIQMAKKDGYKVIASAGSDKKIQFCKDIGADVVFNCERSGPYAPPPCRR
jgi:NADPH-dependent curcumin reductase CurA